MFSKFFCLYSNTDRMLIHNKEKQPQKREYYADEKQVVAKAYKTGSKSI